MLPASAADGHRQVAAGARRKAGQPLGKVAMQVGVHVAELALRLQEPPHRRIQPGEAAELRLPVGVGQAADIKHQVGVHRHPVLVGEGLEQQGKLQAAGGDPCAHLIAQLLHS